MSMPKFPDNKDVLTTEEALNAIITSIALEECALSKILVAESEKIDFVTKKLKNGSKGDIKLLLKTNQSVQETICSINDMQLILKNKLAIATKYLPVICPPSPCPPTPQPPTPTPPTPQPPTPTPPSPCPPTPICTTVFKILPKCVRDYSHNIALVKKHNCHNGIRLCMTKDESTDIILPLNKKYKISIEMKIFNISRCPVFVEIRTRDNKNHKIIKLYEFTHTEHIKIDDVLYYESNTKNSNRIYIRVKFSKEIIIEEGLISIVEKFD